MAASDNFVNIGIPKGKKFRIIYDPDMRQFKLLAINDTYLDEVINLFSDDNPAAFFMSQHGYKAPSRISVINTFGYFDIGMFSTVIKQILEIFGKESIAISREVMAVVYPIIRPIVDMGLVSLEECRAPESFKVDNICDKFSLRDYQRDVIKSTILIGKGRCMFECPTGSGKSFIIANLLYTLFNRSDKKLQTMIYVPNRQLVDQFYGDLLDYGYKKSDLTKFAGGVGHKKGEPYVFNRIIITNRQFVARHMHDIPKIDILIVDEIHNVAPDSSGYTFIENLNAPIKIACSGTIPRKRYHRWKLIGLIGPIVHTENITTLQKAGHLAKLEIVSVNVFDRAVHKDHSLLFSLKTKRRYIEGETDVAFNDAWNAETKYIVENFKKLYTPILGYLETLSGNRLALFDRISFGKGLYALECQRVSDDSKIWYIDGNTPVDERERIRAHFETSDGNILFAQSATFSTGINIKNLPVIAFFFSGKGDSKIIQSIGRTLRLHDSKVRATLIDVVFNFKYSQKHFKERLEIYKRAYQKDKPDKQIKLEI